MGHNQQIDKYLKAKEDKTYTIALSFVLLALSAGIFFHQQFLFTAKGELEKSDSIVSPQPHHNNTSLSATDADAKELPTAPESPPFIRFHTSRQPASIDDTPTISLLFPREVSSVNGVSDTPFINTTKEPPIFKELRASHTKPIDEIVRNLAHEITKEDTTNESKARSIYDWITQNILYDSAEWENITGGASDYMHDHSPKTVLERGTTVCIGYAWLFNDMCKSVGIESDYVIGDVRGYRGTKDTQFIDQFRHAWNVVKLDDQEFHLLDATWGATQEGEDENNRKKRREYYFDTPPEQFIFDHLPENQSLGLVETPFPQEATFNILPNLKPSFFQNNLKLIGNYASVMSTTKDNSSVLTFTKPDDVATIATIGPISGEGEFSEIKTINKDTLHGAIIPPLKPGNYLLRLYSGKGELLECSADFEIEVK